ncbi:MAG: hypothetical protein QM757_17160 [Paludibaculum sp.]
MTAAITLLLGLLCLSIQASGEPEPVIACNPHAIPAAHRARYAGLFQLLRSAVRRRDELAEGYTFHLDGTAISLQETAEWINFERLCCPFLTFQLSTAGTDSTWLLTLTGPTGAKPLLDLEFALL